MDRAYSLFVLYSRSASPFLESAYNGEMFHVQQKSLLLPLKLLSSTVALKNREHTVLSIHFKRCKIKWLQRDVQVKEMSEGRRVKDNIEW